MKDDEAREGTSMSDSGVAKGISAGQQSLVVEAGTEGASLENNFG